MNCTNLTSASFQNAANIGTSAFENCTALTSDDYSWYANSTNWSTLFSASRIKLVSQLGG